MKKENVKKFLLSALIIPVLLTGCSMKPKIINVTVDDDSNLNGTVLGKEVLIEIGSYLYYDSTTRIVYWWNGILAEVPTPYYAPNGLPYRYNPETNTFEEITDG